MILVHGEKQVLVTAVTDFRVVEGRLDIANRLFMVPTAWVIPAAAPVANPHTHLAGSGVGDVSDER